jgi:hypothetical protein
MHMNLMDDIVIIFEHVFTLLFMAQHLEVMMT